MRTAIVLVAAAMNTRLVLSGAVVIATTMGAGLVLAGIVRPTAAIVAWRVLATAVIGASAIDTKHGEPPLRFSEEDKRILSNG